MPDEYAVPAAPRPTVAVAGAAVRFPVRRIFCVGRNYPEHAREMGAKDVRAPPFFFTKPADAVIANGGVVPFPPRTADLHHEIELVVALCAGGRDIRPDDAPGIVFGYAVGIDLTRRDVQLSLKKQGKPWDTAKGFDHSAPISAIAPVAAIGHPSRARIWLEVNGALRQNGDIAEMIWTVPEIIAELSTWFELAPGDLIFTGTPAGVGKLNPGDRVRAGVEGVGLLSYTMAAR
ncbi:MAG: fumarylacetoacetate hydrolase family protein [Steroidobacteraceae bacterium]